MKKKACQHIIGSMSRYQGDNTILLRENSFDNQFKRECYGWIDWVLCTNENHLAPFEDYRFQFCPLCGIAIDWDKIADDNNLTTSQ